MAFLKRQIHSRLVVADGYIGLRDAPAQAARPEGRETSAPGGAEHLPTLQAIAGQRRTWPAICSVAAIRRVRAASIWKKRRRDAAVNQPGMVRKYGVRQ